MTEKTAALYTLRKRAEFLAVAAAGRRWVTKAFLIQAQPDSGAADTIGVGYTASKKVGGAVVRNRAKRRLREVARAGLTAHGQPGWRYVLVARAGDTEIALDRLQGDLKWALGKLASGADLASKKRPQK